VKAEYFFTAFHVPESCRFILVPREQQSSIGRNGCATLIQKLALLPTEEMAYFFTGFYVPQNNTKIVTGSS